LRPGEGQNRDIDRDARRAVEKALRATGLVRSVLDVGTGNGRWLPSVASKKAGLVVALDIAHAELAGARAAMEPDSTPERVAMVCADAGALPVPSPSFDLVLCLEMMPYVRRVGRQRALREMRRVSGRWVVVQYAHNEGASFLWQRIRKRLGLEAHFPRNHLSRTEVQRELRQAGLGVRGFARVGGVFSRSWIVLAEAPSPDWMQH
jgi:ubiquinone/menaquinone biosynthesis C-methylase UbiE